MEAIEPRPLTVRPGHQQSRGVVPFDFSPATTPAMTRSLARTVDTTADIATPVTRNQAPKWQHIIDHKLIEWGRDPSQLADDDIDPPSGKIIGLAIELAERSRDQGLPAPDTLVPDANGGIVFERREKDMSEVFHVWDDGTMEYMCFHGTRVVDRHPIQYESPATNAV